MIFLNHLVGRLKRTNQIMQCGTGKSKAYKDQKTLISEWICSRGLQAPQFHQKTWIFWDDLLKVKVSVMNLWQSYKMTARCDLYIKPIGRYSPGNLQEREKENADRNRLPSFHTSIPFLHKTQA